MNSCLISFCTFPTILRSKPSTWHIADAQIKKMLKEGRKEGIDSHSKLTRDHLKTVFPLLSWVWEENVWLTTYWGPISFSKVVIGIYTNSENRIYEKQVNLTVMGKH